MAEKTAHARAYDTAYESTPEQKKKRALRNKARRLMIKKGLAKVGDGKDVDHKKALKNGGTSSPDNLRVVSQTKNRGWRKGKKGYTP